jgi:hypothetical protein
MSFELPSPMRTRWRGGFLSRIRDRFALWSKLQRLTSHVASFSLKRAPAPQGHALVEQDAPLFPQVCHAGALRGHPGLELGLVAQLPNLNRSNDRYRLLVCGPTPSR